MDIAQLFFSIAKPFLFHISGVLFLTLIFNVFYPFKKHIERILKWPKILNIFIVIVVIILGLYLRLCLSYFSIGNNDIDAYKNITDLVLKGKNIYTVTHRYNYSPLWFIILLGLNKINQFFPNISFHFVVKFFLIIIDLVTLIILGKIAKFKKIPFDKVTVAFFLNPISILISGHHGQFENLTIFFILLGIYFLIKRKKRSISWFLFLIGGIIKHIVFNQVLVVLNRIYKKKIKVVLMFFLSITIFLVTFIPYWQEGRDGIIKHVFLYRSRENNYGITFFLSSLDLTKNLASYYRYLFIIAYFLFAFLFKSKDILKTVLVNSLFFLAFTSGMADQYFVLPIAFASLKNTFGLSLYTLFISLYLFKSSAQLGLSRYNFITDAIIWLVIIIWFIATFANKGNSLNSKEKAW